MLSKEEIQSLYRIYEKDFLMFNYSIENFLNFTKGWSVLDLEDQRKDWSGVLIPIYFKAN